MIPKLDMRGRHGLQPRGKKHYRWRRERLVSSHGYSKIRVGRGHPLADPNGYAYEQLVVWVSAGRTRPKRNEVLRFRNNDRSDCRIENLLLVSRSRHSLLNTERPRDELGRLVSKHVERLVARGAKVRTVRLKR